MKFFQFIPQCLIAFAATALADDGHETKSLTTEASTVTTRPKSLPTPIVLPDDPAELVKKLSTALPSKTIAVLTTPDRVGPAQVTYRLPDRAVLPGEAICFAIPRELRGLAVDYVLIDHRQVNGGNGGYDNNPGLSSVQLHSPDFPEADAWRYWNGPSSGKFGAKFAEGRGKDNPETDDLHEWSGNVGHNSVNSGRPGNGGPLHTNAACVHSVGTDEVRLSTLTIKFLPPKADKYMNAVIAPGTDVGDPTTTAGQRFGDSTEALKLGSFTSASDAVGKLPQGWTLQGREIHIPVADAEHAARVDVAVGDQHDSGPGSAKLSLGYRPKGSTDTQWFVQRENVAPEGVISGSPDKSAAGGGELIVRGEDDSLYIMGIRVGTNAK